MGTASWPHRTQPEAGMWPEQGRSRAPLPAPKAAADHGGSLPPAFWLGTASESARGHQKAGGE